MKIPFRSAAAALAVVAGLTGVAVALGTSTSGPTTSRPQSRVPAAGGSTAAGVGLAGEIARIQAQLRSVPGDWRAWATLALDYVGQAKATVDPTYYPKAEGALRRSLQLQSSGNYLAMAGESTLSAARHDFRGALAWARKGLAIDPRNAVLHGALADALDQLGRYAAAERAARAMELLRPGSDAEARLSYAVELRGDMAGAVRFMEASLAHAATPSDVAFARYYLADLALRQHDARGALRHAQAGLGAVPESAALLEVRARAELDLHRWDAARRDLAAAVSRVPQPSYVLEYARLLQAMGDRREADRQYVVFRAEQRLFKANGVTLDTDQTLYLADSGHVQAALANGRASLRTRPFLESWDAYAWSLHRAGRDRAALQAVNRSLATGFRSPLFLAHRAMINKALGSTAAARADARAALAISPEFDPILAPALRALTGTRSPR